MADHLLQHPEYACCEAVLRSCLLWLPQASWQGQTASLGFKGSPHGSSLVSQSPGAPEPRRCDSHGLWSKAWALEQGCILTPCSVVGCSLYLGKCSIPSLSFIIGKMGITLCRTCIGSAEHRAWHRPVIQVVVASQDNSGQ